MAFWTTLGSIYVPKGCQNDAKGHKVCPQDTPNGTQVQPKGTKSYPKGVHVEPMASQTHLGMVFRSIRRNMGYILGIHNIKIDG